MRRKISECQKVVSITVWMRSRISELRTLVSSTGVIMLSTIVSTGVISMP